MTTSLSRKQKRLQKKFGGRQITATYIDEAEKGPPLPPRPPRMKRLTFLIKAGLGEFGELFRRQTEGKGT